MFASFEANVFEALAAVAAQVDAVAEPGVELLRNLAPAFSLYFLEDLLDRILTPAVLQLTNSDGEDMEFMRLVYRLAEDVTPAQVAPPSIELRIWKPRRKHSGTGWNRKKQPGKRGKLARTTNLGS